MREELGATESLAGPCLASVVPLVSVSSPAVACFFPCLSCHPCLPCLLLLRHFSPSPRWLCRSASSVSFPPRMRPKLRRFLTLPPVGPAPTEHASLSWT